MPFVCGRRAVPPVNPRFGLTRTLIDPRHADKLNPIRGAIFDLVSSGQRDLNHREAGRPQRDAALLDHLFEDLNLQSQSVLARARHFEQGLASRGTLSDAAQWPNAVMTRRSTLVLVGVFPGVLRAIRAPVHVGHAPCIPSWRRQGGLTLATGARGSAGFPTCCFADFPVGGARPRPSPLGSSHARRLENPRNGRLESLRYVRRQTRA
jgi:hypothetical protein